MSDGRTAFIVFFLEGENKMPKSKKQGLCLSLIMSLIMIYVMAALNMAIRLGHLSGEVWLALQRLPLGYVVGVLCDLCICTPLSRRIVQRTCSPGDKEMYQVFVLRFCMVVLMTVFSVIVSGKFGRDGLVDFFTYLPYNFTIALPLQMPIVAPLSLRAAQKIAKAE